MTVDLWLAYQSDLQYIKGRLALIRYLKEGRHPEGAGQVMSDLIDHMDHGIARIARLVTKEMEDKAGGSGA